jgi:anti-sigma regulatory factor (Ser/Thr protein kinase)
MPDPSTNGSGDVTIAIARDPALVRTVRLVAAAVARRADCPDTLVEEIRLAVGEACAVMIGANPVAGVAEEQVEVRIRASSAFAVRVTGRVEAEEPGFEDIGLDPWALLRGISEDLTVSEDQGTTTLEMSWGR